MTTFEAREQAFEAKFALDEELAFRVTARRDKLLAHWLGTWLEFDETARIALTHAILAIPNTAPHDERLRVLVDRTVSAHGRSLLESAFAERLRAFGLQAKAELIDG